MNEVVLVTGSRGSGKSTLARMIADGAFPPIYTTPLKRAVAVDPSGDWARCGWQSCTTLKTLNEQMARRWNKGFHLTYTPPADQEALALSEISKLLFWYQDTAKLYAKKDGSDDVCLIVDEAAWCYSNAHAQSKKYPGFGRVLLVGRHYGIGAVVITQFPQDVSTRVRNSASRRFIFATHDANARDAVKAIVGKEWMPSVQALASDLVKATFLSYDQGKVTRHAISLKKRALLAA